MDPAIVWVTTTDELVLVMVSISPDKDHVPFAVPTVFIVPLVLPLLKLTVKFGDPV